MVVAAAVVVLAVLKPWAPPEPPAPTVAPRPSPAAPTAAPTLAAVAPVTSSPSPSPSPTLYPWDDPALFHCVGVRSWLLVTDEIQRQGPIRTWIRVDPVIGATGPDDPTIPWYRIAAASVPGIGVCLPNAPAVPGASPFGDAAGTTIVVRRPRDASGPVRGPWEEVHVAPHAGDVAFAGGAMVAPDRATGDGTWAPGDYLIEVRPGYVGPSAWFGLRIAEPLVPPSAAPSPAATAHAARPATSPTPTPAGPDAGGQAGAPTATPVGP